MDKVNVEYLSTTTWTCYKTIKFLTGHFELIIILPHSHIIVFYKGHK